MAYVFCANETAVSYMGISIYHVYTDNFQESGRRAFKFSTEEYGCEADDDAFDVREKPGYDARKTVQMNLVEMIRAGQFGETKDETEISKEDSEANFCPCCHSGDLDYEAYDVLDEGIKYPYTCNTCGVSGKEYATFCFDGHELE